MANRRNHHHHHHHHHDSCCSEVECHECCDDVCEAHEHHHHHEEGSFAHELLEMADEAWMEVLKEKIKEHIVKAHGKNLDKLAQLVSESNAERWKSKLALQKNHGEYLEKIAHFFSQGK